MVRHPLTRLLPGLILALTAFAVPAQFDPPTYQGGRGQWQWEGNVAKTIFDNGLAIAIAFSTDDDCDTAYFGLIGNDQVTSMSFIIDQHQYKPLDVKAVDAGNGTPLIGFPLSDQALYDLKHGQILRVLTDQGNLNVGLTGTALAFNNAYGNCLLMLQKTTLQPSNSRLNAEQAGAPSKPSAPDKLSRIELENGTVIVMFSGEFEAGDGQRIITALEETGASALGLNSVGGLVSEAQMVGYYLRSHNLDTIAGEVCASACIFALAGGVDRLAIDGARIGLHQSYVPGGGSLEDGQRLVGNYIRYFQSMGVDAEVVALAATMPSEGIRWIDPKRAMELKLIGAVLP
ncbi:hypothetical protein [Thermochromatium tepidum]|nr:hypothetical protein [Thermochromatium tepidum]